MTALATVPAADPAAILATLDRDGGVIVSDYVARLTGEVTAESPMLSTREREVLQLIAEGQSTAAIAERLHVSVKTVETHRKRLMDKLDIRSVAGLTKYAIREGITSVSD